MLQASKTTQRGFLWTQLFYLRKYKVQGKPLIHVSFFIWAVQAVSISRIITISRTKNNNNTILIDFISQQTIGQKLVKTYSEIEILQTYEFLKLCCQHKVSFCRTTFISIRRRVKKCGIAFTKRIQKMNIPITFDPSYMALLR